LRVSVAAEAQPKAFLLYLELGEALCGDQVGQLAQLVHVDRILRPAWRRLALALAAMTPAQAVATAAAAAGTGGAASACATAPGAARFGRLFMLARAATAASVFRLVAARGFFGSLFVAHVLRLHLRAA
jgi:hypothetical protein